MVHDRLVMDAVIILTLVAEMEFVSTDICKVSNVVSIVLKCVFIVWILESVVSLCIFKSKTPVFSVSIELSASCPL